jgi:hypothetical protein
MNFLRNPHRSLWIDITLYLTLSAVFLVLGFWYPLWLDHSYDDPDFRAGAVLFVPLIAGCIYGFRAVNCLLRLWGWPRQQPRRAKQSMSRTLHLVIGILLGLVSPCCVVMGFMIYASPRASPEGNTVGAVVLLAALALASAYGAFWNIAKAFRATAKELRSPERSLPELRQDLASGTTPDEKLAHLVKLRDV